MKDGWPAVTISTNWSMRSFFCNVKGIGIDFDAVQVSCFLCDLAE
jgi:hypothetical protein